MARPRVPVVPPSTDFLNWCAWELLQQHPERAPDLSRVTVILPNWSGARALRKALARHAGQDGLLGPTICRLDQFAAARAEDGPVPGSLDCRLMLRAALARHPTLAPGLERTAVADALFELFEEMNANAVHLPDTESGFEQLLAGVYGGRAQPYLSAEARIIYRLWQAFIDDSGGRSPALAYRSRLAYAFEQLDDDEQVHIAGADTFSRGECQVVSKALKDGRAGLWLHGRIEGRDGQALRELAERLDVDLQAEPGKDSARGRLLDEAYAEGQVDPTTVEHPGLHVVETGGSEAEARCVELAVRQAYLRGARDIVVLSQDRRLARRLRALLERAGLPLQDAAGWALSTSSAAALADAWFECLDQGFHFRPLLEVLKSGFVNAGADAVELLETELVYRRRIERGLDRLLAASPPRSPLRTALARVVDASRAMGGPGTVRSRSGQAWARGLLESLEALGARVALQQDAAGGKLWSLVEQMQAAFKRHPDTLDREAFRTILTRAIEAETFVPDASPGPVRLLTLEQSQNLRCDYLVIAGASREQIPGPVAASPLFNQAVRAELGLPDWAQRQALGLARWRRALEAAPAVLVTYSAADIHDDAQPSPWLEALESCARRSGLSLRDEALPQLAGTPAVEIAETSDLPESTRRPTPQLPTERWPGEFSASAHQSLVDCPYKFFAQYGLGLKRPEAPDEEADRSDYGEHVHRVLQAFTEQLDELPAPFGKRVTEANRAEAQARLDEIARAVFEPELRQRALALSWLAEFRASMPGFLDWLQERPATGDVRAEVELTRALDTVVLKGTLDRLETRADGRCSLVDYKTGRVPKEADVLAGEHVQLPHYAGLDDRIATAEFLALKEGEKNVELGQALPELRARVERRLEAMVASSRAGAGLPANGDEGTCKYCDYGGICRRQDWVDD